MLSSFFPSLYEEFFSHWPLPLPTAEGIEAAEGDILVAVANMRKLEERVRDFCTYLMISILITTYSECTGICRTGADRSMVGMGRAPPLA